MSCFLSGHRCSTAATEDGICSPEGSDRAEGREGQRGEEQIQPLAWLWWGGFLAP